MFENPKSSKAILSPRAFLCCLATPDDKNITISALFEKCHMFDAYLALIKGYIWVCMSIHYLSKS